MNGHRIGQRIFRRWLPSDGGVKVRLDQTAQMKLWNDFRSSTSTGHRAIEFSTASHAIVLRCSFWVSDGAAYYRVTILK
jgi:hypothetical protein